MILTGQTNGYEGEHLSIAQMANLKTYLSFKVTLGKSTSSTAQRLKKFPTEIELSCGGAAKADLSRYIIRDALHVDAG